MLPLVSVCSTEDSLALQSSLLFSAAPTHPKYSGSPSVLWIRWDRNQFLGLFPHTHTKGVTLNVYYTLLFLPTPKAMSWAFSPICTKLCCLGRWAITVEMKWLFLSINVTGLGFEFAWILKFLSWFLEVLIKALRTIRCC